jgi:ribosome-associated protein
VVVQVTEQEPSDVVGVLRVTRTLVVPLRELAWRVSTTGGPGGQHANRAQTRVEVRFDIAGSPSLGPVQRARLLERYGPELRVVSGAERSQVRNRARALALLAERLRSGLAVRAPRRPTAPTRTAVERRLAGKRRRSDLKQARQRPSEE